jgi:hypothetical protein
MRSRERGHRFVPVRTSQSRLMHLQKAFSSFRFVVQSLMCHSVAVVQGLFVGGCSAVGDLSSGNEDRPFP